MIITVQYYTNSTVLDLLHLCSYLILPQGLIATTNVLILLQGQRPPHTCVYAARCSAQHTLMILLAEHIVGVQ